MAFSLPSTVSTGQVLTAAQLNSYRTSIDELQNALSDVDTPLIRRRDTRASTVYANGDQTLTPNAVTENVGGITLAGSTYTVPSVGTYAMTLTLTPTAALTGVCGLMITAGGVQNIVPIQNGTGLDLVMSIVQYLAAAATITLAFRNGTGGNVTATLTWAVTKLTRI